MDSIEEEKKYSIEKKKWGTVTPTFPLARFVYLGFNRVYYPFGNTPAEDLLENCSDNLQPSVLVLGCGDMRSCFYTLWTNLDSSISTAPKRFKGACFTLNDHSAAVLARNIIFLYLCLHLPEDSTEKKKWLCAMWAIWYCNELYPNHLDILDATLKALLNFSDTIKLWSSEENPLHQLVQFTSSSCLSEVAGMWRMWLHRTVHNASMQNIHESRKRLQEISIPDIAEYSSNFSKSCAHVHGDNERVQAEKAAARAPEVRSYQEVGSCYAENVVDLNLPKKPRTKVNITIYERQDGKYNCFYGLIPFESYFHAVEFSPQFLSSNEVKIPYDILVSSASFKSKPFLANSFQQFSLWIQSSSSVLKDKDITIMFNFDCQDATAFCQQQMQQNRINLFKHISICRYDIITTSNLMDHLSPSNLIITCVPLLRDDGLFITTSMCCKNCTNTGEELLNVCFGFDTKLFPVVLGVRCISHEGSNYSNPVIIDPFLTDLSHTMLQCLPHIRKFVWVKVSNAQKLTFSQLPCIMDNNITEALVNLIGSCVFGLLNYGPGHSKTILGHNGIETALGMLERFICLSDKSTSDYSYWAPLCTALKHVASPFVHCFQTQAQLHNIHVHLTISEKDCPICQQQKVLAGTLGVFCVNIDLARIRGGGEPWFLVFVHQCVSTDHTFLLEEAKNGRNVHIFDSFDAITSGNTLQLIFFAPLMFVQKRYFVTVTMVQRSKFLNIFRVLFSTTLEDIQIPWIKYDFGQSELSSQLDLVPKNALFGTITSHVCDGDTSETKISLSKAAIEILSTTKLSSERILSSKVKLYCNSLTFQLNLSYPINYDSMKMEVNSGVLTVTCERQRYSLEEERPCFIVSPDHQLCPVPNNLSAKIVHSQSLMQMTRRESQLLTSKTGTYSAQLQVKIFLQGLFKHAMCHSFFSISFERNVHSLIVINKILFDYQHKTPAIDLAFCFVDNFDQLNILKMWDSILHSLKVQPKQLSLKETELEYLKTVLGYFSRRTNGTLLSAGSTSKYAVLQKFDLDYAFTRCVLYFLLYDPDVKFYAARNTLGRYTANILPNIGGVHCTFCNKLSFTTKKCAVCTQVDNYCSKKCQRKHWLTHKKMCKKTCTEATPQCDTDICVPGDPLPKCGYCNKLSNNLKKCMKCHSIQYCDRDCRSRHWPEHKKVCTEKVSSQDLNSSSDSTGKCAYCKRSSASLKKCTKCHSIQYCNRDCQLRHWPEHKKVCTKKVSLQDLNSSSDSTGKCAYCKRSSASLKKCTKCHSVQYCDRDCQLRHWPEHKKVCTEKVSSQYLNSSSDSTGKCAYCKRSSASLKKCTKCCSVQYCDQDCQLRHWPEHKRVCTKKVAPKQLGQDLNPSSDPTGKCAYCKRASASLKKCIKCHSVQYCDRNCQSGHWPEHKKVCIEKTTSVQLGQDLNPSSDPTGKCAYCKRSSACLKKCTKCHSVQYCDRDCQLRHWPEHKKVCA